MDSGENDLLRVEELLLLNIPDVNALKTLRDTIIKNEKIDKQSALLITDLYNASEIMLLDLHFRKDKEVQSIKHELALLESKTKNRDMVLSVCNDTHKILVSMEEHAKGIFELRQKVVALESRKK